MKTMMFCISLVMVLLFPSVTYAVERDATYVKTMEEVIPRLYGAKSVDDIMQCKNQLERVHSVYEKEWMPLYYLAYANVQQTFYDRASTQNEKYLDQAKGYLEKLDQCKNADASEVKTLWGYYYNALTALNPEVNGQAYYTKVLSSFAEAIELDPANPRPVCLMAMYEQYLPAFLKSGKVAAEEKEKARKLFEQEKPSIDKPYWGAGFLEWIKGE